MIVDNKLMKYIMFKKRTEYEVKTKCENLGYTQGYTVEVIEYLKEAQFINDNEYIKRYIQNIKKLKKMSVKEIRFDLKKRGIDDDDLEKYIDADLYIYEEECARDLFEKKMKQCEDEIKAKSYLLNKGYNYSVVSKLTNKE